MIVAKIIFWISAFIIFWAMIGYPISLKVIERLLKERKNLKDNNYKPKVTLMIVAHNEEKVILEKLKNSISLDYPTEKLEILVASDNSTDKTNEIVKEFIKENTTFKIKLYEAKERRGKTNAQNEAAKGVESDILVMTDANSIFEKNAISELVSSFSSEEIVYVCGKLVYVNKENETGKSESTYWNIDLKMREIESNIQTITAGNGAIYACRTNIYHDFDPIKCHDSAMPLYYALKGKRAIFNKEAIAYEKAGETSKDEFKRKVRMSRIVLNSILPELRILNIFKYKWFTYFYLGHRTCRYLLWLAHILLLITNVMLSNQVLYAIVLSIQLLVYITSILKHIFGFKNKIINILYYYCMTILAQLKGVINTLTGRSKPFWEKVESTR